MATSSSAKKLAKLASRGKGKKVRFQGGTTFPTIVAVVSAVMLLLVVYSRATVPAEETGAPQPGDNWSIAYGIRVCDEWLPSLTGTAAELEADVSTGDMTAVETGSDADGIIHYHPQTGGNTGRKAKLGVFLNQYGIKLSDTRLELPEAQVAEGETRVWDTADFECDGKETQIRVRVWDDYTSGAFVDNVTDFSSLRFTRSGMVFAIAIVPKDADIPQPDSAQTLADLGVIGAGSSTGSTDTTGVTETTGATETTAAAAETTVAAETTAATPTTGG
ncbi:MAG: hypothetical protein RJB65_43 [Actinomycetota bacterium]